MKINIKIPELKTLNELNKGEVFNMIKTDDYFIKTSMGPYDNDNNVVCINLKTGDAKQIHPDTPVKPIEAELNIF